MLESGNPPRNDILASEGERVIQSRDTAGHDQQKKSNK